MLSARMVAPGAFRHPIDQRRGCQRMGRIPVVNQDDCVSCRLCNDVAGATFGLNDDDIAYVLDPHGSTEDEIQEAIDGCPSACISWGDE